MQHFLFCLASSPAFSDAFLYSGGSFTTIAPGSTFSSATGINTDGQIVGAFMTDGSGGNGTPFGFLYNNGNYTTIAPAGSVYSWATGINTDGPDRRLVRNGRWPP